MADEKEKTAEETAESVTAEENAEKPEEAQAAEQPEETPEKPEKKNRWKKDKKRDERDEKIEALTDQLKRLMAEFDNYRKRTEKEKAQSFEMGSSSVIEKILPVVDNFERGLHSVPEAERESATYTGMDLIYKQLMKMLTDAGVEPINAEGKEFDPNLHNAVMQVENEDLTPGTVAAELQKGYLYKGSVIRHSMVSVVQES